MKTIAIKAQKTFEAAIRMVMIKEGKNFRDAQEIVLEVVREYKSPNVTKYDMKMLIAALEITFLDKKIQTVISKLIK